MSKICRSCLTKNQTDYCSLLTVFPEFEKKSILDLLNFVTSSEITYSQNLPCEICLNCFKKLKITYSFIVLFKNSQAVLQGNAKKLPEKDSKSDNSTGQGCAVFKKEVNLDHIFNDYGEERIVIVNDDGSTYVDMVEEIFGSEETEETQENTVAQIKKTEIKSSSIDKTHKIILVPADDVLKQKTSLKLRDNALANFSQGNVNISYQDEVFFNEEDEVFFKEEEEVFLKEDNEVCFAEEDKVADIRNANKEDDVLIEAQLDDIHSINDSDEDQEIGHLFNTRNIEIIKSKKTDKSRHKIILVPADDVLKQKSPLKPRGEDLPKNSQEFILGNISNQKQQDKIFVNEEEEENASLEEENEVYFSEENKVDDTSEDCKDEDNISYQSQDSEEDEDMYKEILEIAKNRDKNINNIQIVTIDDVLNSSKQKSDDNKRILSVEDVLKIKPRSKKHKADDEVETFSCDMCDSTFDGRRKLMLHKLRIHNPNWKEKFKCPICGVQSKTMSAHRHHLTKHEDKRYPCELCQKTYMSKSKMRDHVLRVHEKKMDNKYLCTTCGKGFKFSNALEYHMNKHTNSRNFICRYCGFACFALSALKRHERIHTGERPYECKHCKKTFAGAAEKQKHEFGHEGVFRYHCKYCSKKFIQTYNMKVHWMQHTGPYVCEICERNFADAEILKFHYAHTHRIKDVIIEEQEVKGGDRVDDMIE